MEKVRIGVIGCGNISPVYLGNMTRTFGILDVRAVVDLIRPRAEKASADFGIPVIYDTDGEMFADDDLEILINLTTPPDHAWLSLAALEAGRNVYSEKPLAILREDGRRIRDLARRKGLLAGGAPDTFMGDGLQACRRILDGGLIGQPVACAAFMACRGHESWHPDPEFYYKAGGGPMLDMGPYYLTALVSLLGPVESVTGSTRISFPTRTITSAKKYGSLVKVDAPTHCAGNLNFKCGAVGTIVMSFDIWASGLPRIEIYGSEGTLSLPDPNTFGGPVRVYSASSGEWRDVPVEGAYTGNVRGLGVADMAHALRGGRPNRAGADLAYHVLDIMQAVEDSSREGIAIRLESACGRPAPMPAGIPAGTLD